MSCFGVSSNAETIQNEVIIPQFITAERQVALTPESVLIKFKQRNKDFVNGNIPIRNTLKRIRKAVVVLSCIDSRVPVEDVYRYDRLLPERTGL